MRDWGDIVSRWDGGVKVEALLGAGGVAAK